LPFQDGAEASGSNGIPQLPFSNPFGGFGKFRGIKTAFGQLFHGPNAEFRQKDAFSLQKSFKTLLIYKFGLMPGSYFGIFRIKIIGSVHFAVLLV
jgi:hypothetical protein